MTLREALHALFCHRRILWVVPVLAVAGVLAWSLIGTRQFESTARLLVTSADAEGVPVEGSADPQATSGRAAMNEVELLTAWELPESEMAPLIRSLRRQEEKDQWLALRNRFLGEPDRTTLEARLRAAAHFEVLPGTDIVELRFGWSDPVIAHRLAQAFVESYVAERKKQPTSKTNVVKVQPGQLATRADVDARIAAVEDALAILAVKEQHLERQIKNRRSWIETPDLGVGASDLTRLDGLYFELQSERDRLIELYHHDARAVVAVDKRLAQLRKQKAESVRAILDLRSASLEDEHARLYAKRELIEADPAAVPLASIVAEPSALPSVLLIAKPQLPSQRFARFDQRVLGYGLLAGLGLAILLALFLDRFDPRLHRARDLEEALGIPVLATIPTRKVVHHGSSRAR